MLLVFILGLVPCILWRAWIGALAWTWIGLMNPHLYTWTLRDFPFAQLVGIAFLIGWIIARDKRMIPLTSAVIGLCLLLMFVIAKTPFAWYPDVAWPYLDRFVKAVGGALLTATLIYSAIRVRWLLWTILFSLGVFYGVKGGVFALATAGELRVQGPDGGFINGNTHLGVALLMVLPMFVAFIRDAPSVWWKRAGIVSFWFVLIACVFTYSRGTWLGLAAITPLLILQTRRKFLSLAALAVFAAGIAALAPEKLFSRAETISTYEEDLSSMQRIQGWGVAFNVATRYALGSGFVLDATPVDIWMQYANFHHPAFNRANAAHSIYFQWLGDHGFFGLALFLFVAVATMASLWRVRRFVAGDAQRAWLGHYAVALLIGLVGYLVAGAFVSLGYFDLFYTFVVLAAILLREAREAAPVPDAANRARLSAHPIPSPAASLPAEERR